MPTPEPIGHTALVDQEHISTAQIEGAARVWIFHGDRAAFASGVFLTHATGLAWAARHRLTGILTEYPVGEGCYDQAVRQGRFRPSKPRHGSPGHVAAFSPGLRHTHITDGVPV
jgi:hypothetical protein